MCPSSKLPYTTYKRGQDTISLFEEASARLLVILAGRLLRLIVGPGARTQGGSKKGVLELEKENRKLG